MLQTADLIIKLNPNDDVVIARVELPAGTELIKQGVRVAVNVPAGHKVAIRDVAEGQPVHRYNQIIGFATRPIRAGEHVHVHNLAMGDFQRDYAFCQDYKPTQFVANPPHHGHPPRGWPRGHAQLRRRGERVNCSATPQNDRRSQG
jgi:altronate hydrolase